MVVLPAPDGPDQRHHLAGLDREGHVVEHLGRTRGVEHGHRLEGGERHLFGRRVAEVDVVVLDGGRAGGHRTGVRGVDDHRAARSRTSKTRSKETSAVMTSICTFDSAVSGA